MHSELKGDPHLNLEKVMNATCITSINSSIKEIQIDAKANSKLIEKLTDNLLDAILELTSIIDRQTQLMIRLDNNTKEILLYADVADLSDTYIRITKLNDVLTKTYLKIANNKDIYSCVKSATHNYRNALRDLKESTEDLNTVIKLKNNSEYKSLINSLNLI